MKCFWEVYSDQICFNHSLSSNRTLQVGLVQDNIPGSVNLSTLNSSKPGFSVEITAEICNALNYQCQYHISSSSEYGDYINGSWAGFLGEFLAGNYSLSLPYFAAEYQRFLHFDINTQFGVPAKKYFITRKGHSLLHFTFNIFKPLSYKVWLAIFAAVILFSITMQLLYLSNLFDLKYHTKDKKYFFEAGMCAILYLARKGYPLKLISARARMLLLTWGLCSIILTSSYTSGLVSQMLRSTETQPFTNLNSLIECIEQNECKMTETQTGNRLKTDVKNSVMGSQLYRLKLALEKNPPLQNQDNIEMFDHILSENQIFLVTWPISSSRILDFVEGPGHDCQFSLILHGEGRETFPFRKKDPIAMQFYEKLLKMEERGIITKIMRSYEVSVEDCRIDSKKGRRGLKLAALALPLQLFASYVKLLMGGYALASLCLMFEQMRQPGYLERLFSRVKDILCHN